MTPDQQRYMAAVNLVGCVEGMILAGAIPNHSVEYVMGFTTALRKAHGLAPWTPPQRLPVCNDNTSIAALDAALHRIAEVIS